MDKRKKNLKLFKEKNKTEVMVTIFTIGHPHAPENESDYDGSLTTYHEPNVTLPRVVADLRRMKGGRVTTLSHEQLDASQIGGIDDLVERLHSPLYWQTVQLIAQHASRESRKREKEVYFGTGVHTLRRGNEWEKAWAEKLAVSRYLLRTGQDIIMDLCDYALGDTYTKIGPYEETVWGIRETVHAVTEAIDEIFFHKPAATMNHVIGLPGHHAGYDLAQGYCFLDFTVLGAMYAVERYVQQQDGRVLIIDLDNHFGNGFTELVDTHDRLLNGQGRESGRGNHAVTRQIMYLSVHANTANHFPRQGGERDEPERHVFNVTLPHGTGGSVYLDRTTEALARIQRQGREIKYIIVGLGTDAHEQDRIGKLKLRTDDYHALGRLIRTTFPRLPVTVVQEGGYNANIAGEVTRAFSEGIRTR